MRHTLLRTIVAIITATTAFGLHAALVNGRISCQGRGVANVPVSDGRNIVLTNQGGYYTIDTDKKLGYVFYTLPSGYEPKGKEAPHRPAIWAHLDTEHPEATETHDFELKKVDNSKFELVVVTDIHLANRANDIDQFATGFMPRIKEYVAKSDVPVYTVALGDLSWDRYWYANEYGPADFCKTLEDVKYPTLFFPVTGNHDNNPSIPAGPDTDYLASEQFRTFMAPSYYSFNLGNAHIVVLDDIVYKNDVTEGRKYAQGIVGNRNYHGRITDEQMEWLRHDLALADKNNPVFVCMHIPAFRLTFDGKFTPFPSLAPDGRGSVELAKALSQFPQARILTGHTHFNTHVIAPGFPTVHEDNVSSLCCMFWNTRALGGRDTCSDGSPSAFKVYTFDGPAFTSRMEAVDPRDNGVMRVYDLNTVRHVYATDEAFRDMVATSDDRTDYATFDDNMVLVNVFDYEPAGKLTITENGIELPVTRICADDPLHMANYPVPLFHQTGKWAVGDAMRVNNHMFVAKAASKEQPVEVTYTDAYGRSTKTVLHRPGYFGVEM